MKRGPYKKRPVAERLMRFIEVQPDGCWAWRGYQLKGYGQSYKNGRHVYAHRVAYEEWRGPIPEGLELDHLCRNTLCVNPEHLEPVTHAQNMTRFQATITHCKNGHEFTPQNTYIRPDRPNQRGCRICRDKSVPRKGQENRDSKVRA